MIKTDFQLILLTLKMFMTMVSSITPAYSGYSQCHVHVCIYMYKCTLYMYIIHVHYTRVSACSVEMYIHVHPLTTKSMHHMYMYV